MNSTTNTRKKDVSPAKSACIYISSILLVVSVLSSLSLLRFIISLCHYEYTTGRTVCSPQNVVLEKFPVEIPGRTLFLRIGGSDYYGSLEIFNASKNEDFEEMGRGSTIEHTLTHLDSSNFSRFHSLRELTLFRCGVEFIAENTFVDLHKLRKLILRSNKLTWLQEGAFSGLTNLTLLDLSYNPLKTIGNYIFTGSRIGSLVITYAPNLSGIDKAAFENASVENIRIERCALTNLYKKSIASLKSSLKTFTVVNNLKKISIEENFFQDFDSLLKLNFTNASLLHFLFLKYANAESIILDGNFFENGSLSHTSNGTYNIETKHLSVSNANLSDIPEILTKYYKHLKSLNLSKNRISMVGGKMFCDTNGLTHLDLSSNNISSLEENLTIYLPSLVHFYIHSNQLTSISQNLEPFFKKLEVLTISDNPLQCNCDLLWFADWLKSSILNKSEEMLNDLKQTNCTAPTKVNILKAEDGIFLCHPPNITNVSFYEPPSEDVVILECLVTGDPTPTVTWESISDEPAKDQMFVDEALPSLQEPESILVRNIHANNISYKVQFSPLTSVYAVHSQLNVSKPGNYTCIGSSRVGHINHTFDTNLLPITNKNFQFEQRKKVELLSSLEGAVVAAVLLLIIGYLIKRDSELSLQSR